MFVRIFDRRCLASLIVLFPVITFSQPINRQAVVQRHNVHVNKIDSLSSLTVGNGYFAFTVDATGMQSFPEAYATGVPLGTQSVWGWHSFPNTENLKIEEAQKVYELEGRKISYTVQPKEPERARKAVEYFRVNPHRLQLGNIGLEIKKKDGSLASVDDIQNIEQQLDLWTGTISSSFTVEGVPVKVITAAHYWVYAVSFRIESPLLSAGQISIRVRIPYPNGQWKDVGDNWDNKTSLSRARQFTDRSAIVSVHLDTTNYYLSLAWNKTAKLEKEEVNYYKIQPEQTKSVFEFSCLFHQTKNSLSHPKNVPSFESTWLSGSAQATKINANNSRMRTRN